MAIFFSFVLKPNLTLIVFYHLMARRRRWAPSPKHGREMDRRSTHIRHLGSQVSTYILVHRTRRSTNLTFSLGDQFARWTSESFYLFAGFLVTSPLEASCSSS